jgi:hypothetical protein
VSAISFFLVLYWALFAVRKVVVMPSLENLFCRFAVSAHSQNYIISGFGANEDTMVFEYPPVFLNGVPDGWSLHRHDDGMALRLAYGTTVVIR